MDKARIDSRYTNRIQNIYENATLHVKIEEDMVTDKIPIRRGVRQGDSISPKLFTLALEDIFKNLHWEKKGINIFGVFLSHLRFADDIILFSSDVQELREMIEQLNANSKAVGLKMNLVKTKILSSENVHIEIENQILEVVDHYVYLGHNIKLGKDNQTSEIKRRVGLTWAAFGKLRFILNNEKIPINLKREVYESCVLPVTTYGLETLTFTKNNINRLKICQRAMERSMLGINFRDGIRNEDIRNRTRVTDPLLKGSLKGLLKGSLLKNGDGQDTLRELMKKSGRRKY